MVRWIKMPLGMEIGLGSSDIVLDGDPAPHGKGHSTAHFSAHIYCSQTIARLSSCWAPVQVSDWPVARRRLTVSDCVLQNVVVAVQVQVAGIIGSRRRGVHHELRRRQWHRDSASSRSVTAADHDITAARQENYASITVLTEEKTTTTTGTSTTACRQQVHMGTGQWNITANKILQSLTGCVG